MTASQERPGDEANDVVMFSHFLGQRLEQSEYSFEATVIASEAAIQR